jgi:hypothetical protein
MILSFILYRCVIGKIRFYADTGQAGCGAAILIQSV